MPWQGEDRRRTDRHSLTLDIGEHLAKLLGGQIGVPSPSQKLDAIIEMLHPLGGVPTQQDLHTEALNLIRESINILERKVDEFMATQEERLQGIQTKLDSVASGIDTLQQQVADLKANNPDMEDEIAGLEATVQRIADDISGASTPGTGGDTETPPEGTVTP